MRIVKAAFRVVKFVYHLSLFAMILSILLSFAAATVNIACRARSNISVTSDDYFVKSCFFYSLSSTSNGGAISFVSASNSIFIFSSLFSACYSVDIGGAIYTSAQTTDYSQVCGSDCATSANGFGAFIYITSPSTKISSLCSLTATRCSNDTLIGLDDSILFGVPASIVKCINSSFNFASRYASSFSTSGVSQLTGSYINVYNCTTVSGSCNINFWDSTGITISQMNYVHNANSNGGTIIWANAESSYSMCTISISLSIFSDNSGSCLFGASSYTNMTISNCWLSYTNSLSSGNVYLVSNSVTSTSTYDFNPKVSSMQDFTCFLGGLSPCLSHVLPNSNVFSWGTKLKSFSLNVFAYQCLLWS